MVMTRRQEVKCRVIMTVTKDEGHSKITQDYSRLQMLFGKRKSTQNKNIVSQNRKTQVDTTKTSKKTFSLKTEFRSLVASSPMIELTLLCVWTSEYRGARTFHPLLYIWGEGERGRVALHGFSQPQKLICIG
jgi:hypothetical protein